MSKKAVKILSFFLLLSLLSSEAFAYRFVYKTYVASEYNKIQVSGSSSGEQFGAAISSGDINGDGFDDLIVGSPFASGDGKSWNGKVSVFLGNNSSQIGDPYLAVYGRFSGDQLGSSLASGDFNNDGYDDILIGAYNSFSDGSRTGKAFMILGRSSYDDVSWSLEDGTADVELVGRDHLDGYGLSVACADINNDNVDDILVGAPFAMSIDSIKSGEVYGYYGSTFSVDSVDKVIRLFDSEDADVVFHGKQAGERFGSDIAIGDVVGSVANDIAVSAYFSDRDDMSQSGKVYVYSGGSKLSSDVLEPTFTLEGDTEYGWFGFSIDVGRFNSDRKMDIAVSSFPFADRSKVGFVYIVEGRSYFESQKNVISKDTANYYFEGKSDDNMLGASVRFVDVDSDRKKDVVIGAPGIGASVKSSEEGEIYIYYKDMIDSEQTSFNLNYDDASNIIYGEYSDDWFGSKVGGMDFNGDGYEDIIVSSRYSDEFDPIKGTVLRSNVGKVFVLFGGDYPFGIGVAVSDPGDDFVKRGDVVNRVVSEFGIKDSRKDYIENCYDYREFCFFLFSGQTSFNGFTLEPDIILYPDIPKTSPYYESVTIATMLGLVSGYADEPSTPFKPDDYITRIQALRIILAANQLVKPLYKFELVQILGSIDKISAQYSYFDDVDPSIPSMWWYPRFTNFAFENGIVAVVKNFRPDEFITQSELDSMLQNTIEFLKKEI